VVVGSDDGRKVALPASVGVQESTTARLVTSVDATGSELVRAVAERAARHAAKSGAALDRLVVVVLSRVGRHDEERREGRDSSCSEPHYGALELDGGCLGDCLSLSTIVLDYYLYIVLRDIDHSQWEKSHLCAG
jgi:hypothetical protein